jgi:hypothetical protein
MRAKLGTEALRHVENFQSFLMTKTLSGCTLSRELIGFSPKLTFLMIIHDATYSTLELYRSIDLYSLRCSIKTIIRARRSIVERSRPHRY